MLYMPYPFIRRAKSPHQKVINGLWHCTRCNTSYELTTDNFYRNKGRKTGFEAYCKACHSAQQKSARDANPERLRRNERLYRERHLEEVRQRGRDYGAAHREQTRAYGYRYRKQHPDRVSANGRRHYQANKPMYETRWRRRDAAKRGLPFNWSAADWRRALEHFGYRCAYCGNQRGMFAGMEMSQDHFIPVSSVNCTGTIPTNIVPACASCNKSKQHKDATVWLMQKFGKRKATAILAKIAQYFTWVAEQDGGHS